MSRTHPATRTAPASHRRSHRRRLIQVACAAALLIVPVVSTSGSSTASPAAGPSARPVAGFPQTADAAERWAQSWLEACVGDHLSTDGLPTGVDAAERTIEARRALLVQDCTAALLGDVTVRDAT